MGQSAWGIGFQVSGLLSNEVNGFRHSASGARVWYPASACRDDVSWRSFDEARSYAPAWRWLFLCRLSSGNALRGL